MIKYTIFENTAYKKRLEKRFYRYCLVRQPSLVRFIFGFILFGFLRFFGLVKKEKYLAKRWRFLASVKNLDKRLEKFVRREKRRIYIPDDEVIWLSEHPLCVMEAFSLACDRETVANDYDIESGTYNEFVPTAEMIDEDEDYLAYGTLCSPLMKRAADRVYIYRPFKVKSKAGCAILACLHYLFTYVGMVAWSLAVGFASLYWASRAFGEPEMLFESYFTNPLIVWLNVLPVVLITLLIYALFNSTSFAVFVSSVLVMVATWVNHYKLLFRDDPFLFEDIGIAMEARLMTESYDIVLEKGMIVLIAIIALVLALFRFVANAKTRPVHIRILLTAVLVGAAVFGMNNYYLSGGVYQKTSNTAVINMWSTTQQFQSRGFVYPFLNSISSAFERAPDGYDKKTAAAVLDSYEAGDIPEDKRVNVISVMLEAYGDFTRFEELEFTNDPYHYFKDIAAESYSGRLINNIFAAGTVDTERCFLTGLVELPTFRRTTNSHVWYFRDQGYLTEGGHPSYNWFYNRQNINRNLGFENYYFDDDTYMERNEGKRTANNDILFDHILERFNEVTSKGEDYFSFSVTYEGHGPYSEEPFFWHEYLANTSNWSDYSYNTINNYFAMMEHAGMTVSNMIDELRDSDEPVVVIMFGDHMPWMGNGNSIYEELGLNIDLSTDEGFKNYYETPYFIWANDRAKQILGCDFVGEGPTLSPGFLMSEFFELAGWQGSEYIQYLSELSESIPVVHNTGVIILPDGTLVRDLTEEQQALVDEYKQVQYYHRNSIKK